MEPPKLRFITPVYHPNIDAEGRICLDLLNPPPKGAWKPSLNIGTLLSSIALLLADPNPDDGLVTDTVGGGASFLSHVRRGRGLPFLNVALFFKYFPADVRVQAPPRGV